MCESLWRGLLLVKLFSISVLVLVLCSSTGAAISAPDGKISRQYTIKRATDYVDAYNRHDIRGVLATLDFSDPTFFYSDCDYAFGEGVKSYSKAEVTAWLRARFAEGERFSRATVFNHNPSSNDVAGFNGVRVSDIVRAHGLSRLDAGNKMVINNNGRFQRSEAVNPSCYDTRLRAGASATKTRVMATVFFDAYRAHLVSRVLQALDATVVVRDCDYQYHRTVVVRGHARVARWLRAHFALGDRLTLLGPARVTSSTALLTLRLSDRFLSRPRVLQVRMSADHASGLLSEVDMASASCR